MATKRTCAFVHPDGRHCSAPPLRDGAFCLMHSPEHAEAVAEGRRLGGARGRREAALTVAYDLGELRASKLSWTILRPTAYMETWLALIGQPLIRTGQTRVFGRGDNPINFVSVHDVAEYAVLAVVDPALRGQIVEIGGPDNLTFREVVAMVRLLAGASGTSKYVPRGMMRALALLLKPLQPALARQIQAGVV